MKLDKSTRSMVISFLLPAVVLYLLFFIIPSIQSLYVSLLKWNGFTSTKEFVGLANFKELFLTSHFWKNVMKNTLFIAVFGGIGIFSISFLLAGILSTDSLGKKNSILKNLIFFPSIINPVAVAILWNYIYNPSNGLINGILSFFKVINIPVWTSGGRLFWAVLVAMIWMYSGYYFIIIYSALQRIPPSLIEAAKLEGSGELRIFFSIKLPLVFDVIQVMVVFWIISAIKEFTLFYAWGGGVDIPQAGVQNLATYMQFIAFGKRTAVYRLGYASAMGVIMLILTILSIIIIQKVFNKKEQLEY